MCWCAVLTLSPTLTLTYICCDEQMPSDYLIQRPTDGVIIFGGQRKSVPVERLLGNSDDVQVDLEMATALREALPRSLERWGENSDPTFNSNPTTSSFEEIIDLTGDDD
jgi:hypothetical protein